VLPLNGGATVTTTTLVTIRVIASEGNSRDYTILLTQLSGNADLSAIVTGVTTSGLSSGFSPAVTAYSVIQNSGISGNPNDVAISITPTAADPAATIRATITYWPLASGGAYTYGVGPVSTILNGAVVASGNPIQASTATASNGLYDFRITVTAPDGVSVKTYVVSVYKYTYSYTTSTTPCIAGAASTRAPVGTSAVCIDDDGHNDVVATCQRSDGASGAGAGCTPLNSNAPATGTGIACNTGVCGTNIFVAVPAERTSTTGIAGYCGCNYRQVGSVQCVSSTDTTYTPLPYAQCSGPVPYGATDSNRAYSRFCLPGFQLFGSTLFGGLPPNPSCGNYFYKASFAPKAGTTSQATVHSDVCTGVNAPGVLTSGTPTCGVGNIRNYASATCYQYQTNTAIPVNSLSCQNVVGPDTVFGTSKAFDCC